MAQYLRNYISIDSMGIDNYKPFRLACEYGHVSLASFLWQELKNHQLKINREKILQTFSKTCYNRHFEMAMTLQDWNQFTKKEIQRNQNKLLRKLCKKDGIKNKRIILWLIENFNLTFQDFQDHDHDIMISVFNRKHDICYLHMIFQNFQLSSEYVHEILMRSLFTAKKDHLFAEGSLLKIQYIFTLFPNLNEENLQKIIKILCKYGHVHVLTWFLITFHLERKHFMSRSAIVGFYVSGFHLACIFGNLAAVRWMDKKFQVSKNEISQNNYEIFMDALENGHLQVTKWLYDRSPISKTKFMSLGCLYGNVKVIQWIHSIYNFQLEEIVPAFDDACRYGKLDIAEWIFQNFHLGSDILKKDEYYLLRTAIVNNHLPIVQFLHEKAKYTKEEMLPHYKSFPLELSQSFLIKEWMEKTFHF